MKWNDRTGRNRRRQAGEILPMALVLLAAAIFVLVPALFATQIGLSVNRETEKDTLSYYTAESGIADALWKFKTGNSPFTPSSAVGSYYDVINKVNGMNM